MVDFRRRSSFVGWGVCIEGDGEGGFVDGRGPERRCLRDEDRGRTTGPVCRRRLRRTEGQTENVVDRRYICIIRRGGSVVDGRGRTWVGYQLVSQSVMSFWGQGGQGRLRPLTKPGLYDQGRNNRV